MTLLDKVALVTGGARRLGREIALALAREGCDVVLHYRDSREEADALASEIRALGRQAWCVCGDFSNVYEPAVTMKTAWELAGWVDIPFEDRTYKTMVGYKRYLELTYGDYMTPPPLDQRQTHQFKAWIMAD